MAMKTFLIGNDIVKNLVDPRWEIIMIPNATWQQVVAHVTEHQFEFTNSLVYVHVGPHRFARFHETRRRKELALPARQNLGNVEEIFQTWRDDLMPRLNIIPVICTVYPVDFPRFNRHLKETANFDNRLLLQAVYADFNQEMLDMVQLENRVITAFNEDNSVATPFMHKKVFIIKKQRYHFNDWYLSNGYHPIEKLEDIWCKQIGKAQERNFTRFPFRPELVDRPHGQPVPTG